jgi:hypothetical protein
MSLVIRLAKPDDLRAYAGFDPPAEYCICAALGYVAERDGVIVAISLVTWDIHERAWVWFDAKEPLSPIAMHRRALSTFAVLREVGEPVVYAFCSQTTPGAAKWLDRLGFRPMPELTMEPDHPVWQCVL